MRNSKVRQRIAAGKLKLRIRDLRNLGAKSEQMLGEIGIHTADELRRQGAVRTYAELKRSGASPSLNLLWALAGALDPWPEGTHWREIARGESRLSLLLAVEDLEPEVPRRAAD
jgi:DNA transformation protein